MALCLHNKRVRARAMMTVHDVSHRDSGAQPTPHAHRHIMMTVSKVVMLPVDTTARVASQLWKLSSMIKISHGLLHAISPQQTSVRPHTSCWRALYIGTALAMLCAASLAALEAATPTEQRPIAPRGGAASVTSESSSPFTFKSSNFRSNFVRMVIRRN